MKRSVNIVPLEVIPPLHFLISYQHISHAYSEVKVTLAQFNVGY